MNNRISKIENNVQDRNSKAWNMLCDYIDKIAEEGGDEFAPYEELGAELYSEIFTLPESISKLKKVKKVWLYGSKLKRIPPEIGQLESLEYFDPYTSYNLHWFPFEITECKNLKDSRVSTRALYGNYKNRMGFPRLNHAPVKYFGEKVNCSICKKEMTYDETKQMWITLWIGTDYLPLLANLCSKECEEKLNECPKPAEYYWQYPHQGGSDLEMPKMTQMEWARATGKIRKYKGVEILDVNDEINENTGNTKRDKEEKLDEIKDTEKKISFKDLKPLKLIRKIWEK